MARIPTDEIDRVKREADLVALVQSRGVGLKKKGANWSGLCPFHEDRETPNLIVTPAKGLWRCMASGCGKAGNAIQFVQEFDGLSFRHAFELLAGGGKEAYKPPAKAAATKSTARRLPCPLEGKEDLLAGVAEYYASRLRSPEGKPARDYLEARGLGDEELLARFGVGFADRSLGLRLPNKQRVAGAELRGRLEELGVYRKSGHEHLNGCAVVPVRDLGGEVRQLYGRRIDPKAPKDNRHLYLAQPMAGIFNGEALGEREIILCESILDAMTFVRHGMDGATCTYGTANFTDELFEAIRAAKVEGVRLAFDADKAGEAAATAAAERLQGIGVECHRVKLPWGSDANGFALDQGGEALRKAVRSAEWLGAGSPIACAQSTSSSLAAKEAAEGAGAPDGADGKEAKKEKAVKRGEHWELVLGDRVYRVGGLEKNNGHDVLKIALRVMEPGGLFHIDALDLYRDNERRRFIERASEETLLDRDLIKRDLGKLLLALETLQEERLAPPEDAGEAAPELTPEEMREAIEFGTKPGLIDRIAEALASCGLVGERTNGLGIYLCATSRLLPSPLAAMIQSTSAAGKTTLMEAVLALFPDEGKVKYSAMTGQSLYYMGEGSLKNKVLAIVEEEGAEKASYALKLLQSEKELRIASTGKDPHTGRMETQEYHVEGPASIVLTTTSVEVDEELMNRCLVLSVDESKEQTERIQSAQREADTPDGIMARKDAKDALALLANFQRTLRPMEVANPFSNELTFTADRTRTRRDNTKYLGLIKAIALLHQHGRETITRTTAAGESVEMLPVTLDDIAEANRLAPELLGRSLDELPPQTRRLLEALKEMVRDKMKAKSCEQRHCQFTRKEAREKVAWSYMQSKRHLDALVELEYVGVRGGRNGIAFSYELLVDAKEAEGSYHIGLIDVDKLRTYGDDLNTGEGDLNAA